MKCKNNCIITGDIENLKKLDLALNSNFNMQDVVPLKDIHDEDEKLCTWGNATAMQLQAYMFSDFAPEHIFFASITDAPNELFWRNSSRIYNVEVKYSFYNKEDKYIGLYTYKNGMLCDYEYYEDEKSKEYIDLLNKCKDNFLDLDVDEDIEEVIPKNKKVISINDLRRR